MGISKNTRLLLNQRELVLIKNSDSAKDKEKYGNLFSALQKYDTLSEQDFTKDKTFDKKASSTILNNINKDLLLKNIIDEWSAVEYYETPGERIPCQLCHTPNKHIYYIKNKLNKNELNIGSDCKKQFSGIENVALVVRDFKERDKIRNEEIRRIEFGELEMADPDFMVKAMKNFKDINILLPYNLYIEVEQTLHDLNFLKTDYIKNDGDFNDVKERYLSLRKDYVDLWERAQTFYNTNKRKKLICNKQISNWLKESNKDIWVQVSKNDGFFNEETLKHVYHSEFIKNHILQFKKSLVDKSINIINVDTSKIRFSIQNNNYRNPVYFTMDNKKFMQNIGCYCLTSTTYKFTANELSDILIEINNSNFESLYGRMVTHMRKGSIEIHVDRNTNKIYYKRLAHNLNNSKWSNKVRLTDITYKPADLGSFCYMNNTLLFKDDIQLEKAFGILTNRLNLSGGWISQEQLELNSKLASEAASLQKQKEFIPY